MERDSVSWLELMTETNLSQREEVCRKHLGLRICHVGKEVGSCIADFVELVAGDDYKPALPEEISWLSNIVGLNCTQT